jgi:hypothetical protein
MPASCEPSQSHLSYPGHLRYLPLNKCGHGLYVSRTEFLCQSLDPTLGYSRDLAGGIPDSGRILLRDFLTKVSQDIITCWNFRDKNNVRYPCGVMSNFLTRFPLRSSVVNSSRNLYSSLSKTLKNHGIRINPNLFRMYRYNEVE